MGRTVRKLLLLLVLLAVTAGIAAAVYHYASAEKKPEDFITFTTAAIEDGTRGILCKTVGGTGTVQPREVLLISTDRPGVVVQIMKKAGEPVHEGEELLRLDDRLAVRQVEQAQAACRTAEENIEVANKEVERLKASAAILEKEDEEWQKSGLTPAQKTKKHLELVAAQKAVAVGDAQLKLARQKELEATQALETARLNEKLTHIRMPFIKRPEPSAATGGERPLETGEVRFLDQAPPGRKFTIIDRKVELNQTVGPPSATLLFTVAADPDDVELLAQINESEIADVKAGVGQEAIYSVSAWPDTYFKGEVKEIRPLPVSAQGAVSYVALIRGSNKPLRGPSGDHQPPANCRLRAGMTTSSLDIIVERYPTIKDKHGKAWLVPNTALDYPGPADLYLPRGVTKKEKETPEDWKEKDKETPEDRKEKDAEGAKQETTSVPRLIWLCDPGYDASKKDSWLKGPEATHPVHVLTGKAGKFWDEKRPWLGLRDYTPVRETLSPNAERWPSALVDGEGKPFEAVTGDKPPKNQSIFSKLSSILKF
jgi:multidrug efflux pump subunit AcrA (membrane-fusion protein)